MTTQARVLIADDQPHVLDALRLLLGSQGIDTEAVSSPDGVLQSLHGQSFDLLLMDMNYARDTTSGREGLDLVSRVRTLDEGLPVVVMTGWATVDLAVTAMREGVRDFVLKPWENQALLETIKREIVSGRERRQERHRTRRDLEEARHVQKHLLPTTLPELDGWELAADWRPYSEVGGDYFDFFRLGADRLAFCIADAVGKGFPAALLMSNLQAVVRGAAIEQLGPAEVCTAVNRAMRENLDCGRFISLVYCELDIAGRTLTWANAGHNAGLLQRADGTQVRLSPTGMLLGLADDGYTAGGVATHAGDRLVLFTDGITDALNPSGLEYGDERLASFVLGQRMLGAHPLRHAISTDVEAFCHGRFTDDATLIVLASTAVA
jgi:FixJ family two-component response regulator